MACLLSGVLTGRERPVRYRIGLSGAGICDTCGEPRFKEVEVIDPVSSESRGISYELSPDGAAQPLFRRSRSLSLTYLRRIAT